MIIYRQGLPYWLEMQAFNANKALPGIVLHTTERLEELLPSVNSEAVRKRIHGFMARHITR